MKNSKSEIPLAARNYLSDIGRRGGEAGSKKKKRDSALARWAKPGARKTISGNSAGK